MAWVELSPWHAANGGWTRHHTSCTVFLGAAVLDTGAWRVVQAVIKRNGRQEYKHVTEGKSATVASAKRAASAALRIAVIAHRMGGK